MAAPGELGLTFAQGERVAERYRIVRFLARGGMGEVYAAEDLELNETVALKTIRSDVADPRALERFRREILLARKVTHPNVCRIFDLGRHEGPGGAVAFLTMELLPGETLAERLKREGRLSVGAAQPLAEQMGAALQAAHAAGIVHRDFKTGNVMLVPAEAGTRAVVTDFGLARSTSAEGSSASTTGFAVGTPAYMAPEQVEGAEATARSDIYAFGVVLYEMVTGAPPFAGSSPLLAAARRLSEPPASPRLHVPDLDARWERAILACLERQPARRPGDAREVLRLLAGEQSAPRAWRAGPVGAGLALLLGAALVGLWRGPEHRAAPSPSETQPTRAPAAAVKPRRAVAILGFKNLSPSPAAAWLATAVAEMLATELAAGEQLRVVPGESVARLKAELSLSEAETLAADTLRRIHQNLGSDVIVMGSYVALGPASGGQIRLDLRVQSSAGEALVSVAETGTESALFELVSRAGARLREKLGVGARAPAQAEAVRAALPSDPQAARLYAEGLTRLRLFDALQARERLEQAVRLEPGHALAHAALAQAWSGLGHDAKARAEAQRAFELSRGLSREEQLWIEGRYRELARDFARAEQTYRALYDFFPDNPDYGLRLAAVLVASGHSSAALELLERLRRLPGPLSNDPRIDLAEASAAEAVSDFARCQVAAARAAERAAALGARLLQARALVLESAALRMRGDFPGGAIRAREAQALFEAAGDSAGAAAALRNLANVLYTQGDAKAAQPVYREALLRFRRVGDQAGEASALNNLGVLLKDNGDVARAEAALRQGLALRREIGDRRGTGASLNNLGQVLWLKGQLKQAQQLYEEAIQVLQEVGDRSALARTLTNLGTVLSLQGDLHGARARYEEALALNRSVGDKSGIPLSLITLAFAQETQGDLAGARSGSEEALKLCRESGNKTLAAYALYRLADVLWQQGDLKGSRERFLEAQAAFTEIGEQGTLQGTRRSLAELDLEEGRAREAESAARETARNLGGEGREDDQAHSYTLLVRALLAQGRVKDAAAAARQAAALTRKSQDLGVRCLVRLASAQVAAREGQVDAALRDSQAVADEAAAAGYLGAALLARLTAIEIEVTAGRGHEARDRIDGLERDARARGYGLIAAKAARLRG